MSAMKDMVASTVPSHGEGSWGHAPDHGTPPKGPMPGHDPKDDGHGKGDSFSLEKVVKDFDAGGSFHYNQKDYTNKTDYEKEHVSKDYGSSTHKEYSEHDGGHKGYDKHGSDSGSDYKYSDKDFGGYEKSSEEYHNKETYHEKSFDGEFSLSKSFESLDINKGYDSGPSHHDMLNWG